MKKILFVCERNVVLGPAAEAIFVHMGVRSVIVIKHLYCCISPQFVVVLGRVQCRLGTIAGYQQPGFNHHSEYFASKK